MDRYLIILLMIIYVISPLDLLPCIPLDDLLILFIGYKALSSKSAAG